MREISIETFKREFENIADLVVSLNKEYKAILKPRDEIKKYLESKHPYVQSIIIEELIEVYDYGAISEFYLNNDSKEHGQTIPFDMYFKMILKSVESQIKYEQFEEEDQKIRNIKIELEGINGKSAKINYLLERKKRLEGDYPEALGKILTKNPIYLLINRELEYWREYNEISNNFKDKSLHQLSTNLTLSQRSILFKLLVAAEFIPNEKEDCFIWALGKSDEKQPGQWQPIRWNEAKQGLRELLKPILGTITNQHIRDIEQLFCDKNGNPFRMSKPKKDDNSARCTDIEKILKAVKT